MEPEPHAVLPGHKRKKMLVVSPYVVERESREKRKIGAGNQLLLRWVSRSSAAPRTPQGSGMIVWFMSKISAAVGGYSGERAS